MLVMSLNYRRRAIQLSIVGAIALAAMGLRAGAIFEAMGVNHFSIGMARVLAVGALKGNEREPVENAAQAQAQYAASAPAAAQAQRMLGLLSAKQGDLAGADVYFTKALAGSADTVPLVRVSRPQSEGLARTAYRLYPTNEEAAAWLGDVLAATQPDQAITLYRQAVALAPLDNLTWEKLGASAQARGQTELAIEAFGQACQINPIRNGACHGAARLSYTQGQWDKVIYYFERGFMPGDEADWVLLIRAAQKLGRDGDAGKYLQQAQARNPADYAKLLRVPP